MYTQKDFDEIDTEYFETISMTGSHIIVKSRCTGHTWDITCSEWSFGRELRVSHKHDDSDWFHDQKKMHPRSLQQAQKYIKDHDEWYIRHKKHRKKS